MSFEPKLTQEELDALSLNKGGHSSPEKGHCLLEVVSMFAGEPFGDSPACVDPVLTSFGIAWNDGMRSDAERDQLKRYIPLLPGTNHGPVLSELRAFMAMDWLIRTHTPAWLDLSPALAEHAASLRALAPITGQQTLEAALPALEKAKTASAAAWDAARAAARAAAWDAAWDAARAAAWAAARAAAWDAAWDAAWAAARAAAWDAARAAAWDAARAAAKDSEQPRIAADAALQPTVERLQLSAHGLYLDMINAELREMADRGEAA